MQKGRGLSGRGGAKAEVRQGSRFRTSEPVSKAAEARAEFRQPLSYLHMISWVRRTRHISGFLSWPSYRMG